MADTWDEEDLQLPQYDQLELVCLCSLNKCVWVTLTGMRNYSSPRKNIQYPSMLDFFAQKL